MVATPTGTLTLVHELRGHNGWVTAIAVGRTEDTDLVISASRDKSLIIWDTTNNAPKKRLVGHNHFVQDVAITPDCKHAISGSWDGSLRLWDLQQGVSKIRFVGHTKDVLSVSFSQDSRRILSSSRDKTIKIWNTLGNCVYTYYDVDRHTEWVSIVRFTMAENHSFVSAGWDKVIKVWGADQPRAKFSLVGHTGHINALTVSPDASLCASGGKDNCVMLWDITSGALLTTFIANDVVNGLVFSPTRYWLCGAVGGDVVIWDLQYKVCLDRISAAQGKHTGKRAVPIQCTCLAWSLNGKTLYTGYTDGIIRVYHAADIPSIE